MSDNHPASGFSVAVIDEIDYGALTPERATVLAAAAFDELEVDVKSLGEISVAIVDGETIQRLNLKFRDKDSATDVLSFEIDGLGGEMVGEVVVAPGYVGYRVGEVEELVVHGMLHIGGLDHGEEFEGSEMARVQRRVLEAVGAG